VKEAYLQSKILKALRKAGGWWVKFHNGPRYGAPGTPDILGCYQGMFIALEVKRPGEKPTELQASTIQRIRSEGKGIATVVHSVDEALTVLHNAIKRRKMLDGEKENG